MKRLIGLAFGAALVLPAFLSGCGPSESASSDDAAKVIGASQEDPNYGVASADMMTKMHGDSLKSAAQKKAADSAKPTEAPK